MRAGISRGIYRTGMGRRGLGVGGAIEHQPNCGQQGEPQDEGDGPGRPVERVPRAAHVVGGRRHRSLSVRADRERGYLRPHSRHHAQE